KRIDELPLADRWCFVQLDKQLGVVADLILRDDIIIDTGITAADIGGVVLQTGQAVEMPFDVPGNRIRSRKTGTQRRRNIDEELWFFGGREYTEAHLRNQQQTADKNAQGY